MKVNKIIREIILISLIALALFFIMMSIVKADPHYTERTIIEKTIIEKTIISNCAGTSIAAASGQHHYKATNQLQWSGAGAYIAGACDDSAASFGLAKQLGKVFGAVNYSTDLDGNRAIGFSF